MEESKTYACPECIICKESMSNPVKLPSLEYNFCVECTDTMFLETKWPAAFKKTKNSVPVGFVQEILFLIKNCTYEYVAIDSKYGNRFEVL